MAWPFKKEEPMPTNPELKPGEKPPENPPKNEKSVSEMIAESLKPALDALAQQRQDIEEIKKRTEPRAPKEPPKPTEIPSVLDDENTAFNARMAPIMQRQLELEARQARNDVKTEYIAEGYGEIWKEYEKEIDAYLTAAALVRQREDGQIVPLRGDPEFIRNTVKMVFGGAAMKGGLKFDGGKKTFFLEGSSGTPESIQEAKDLEGLTPKQLAFAKKIGLTPEQMKKSASRLEFVS